MVVADFAKQISNNVSSDKLYFYRDSKGLEVDLIVDSGSKITPIEIKASSTFSSDYLSGIKKFQEISKIKGGKLIYSGKRGNSINGIEIMKYKRLGN